MVLSVHMNQFIMEDSEMKTGRILVLLALVIGLLAGPWQAPAEAIMLGRVGQINNLFYKNGSWYEYKPNGSTPLFTLSAGESFVMTEIRVRFYVSNTNTETGPYRFYLMGPQSSRLYFNNMSDIMYPGSQTVYGGAFNDINLEPGIVFTSPPIPQVQQLPQPPTNPNEGPLRSGTFYITARGYVLP
jgi:hypothetical protein